jgi:hypothetical protein
MSIYETMLYVSIYVVINKNAFYLSVTVGPPAQQACRSLLGQNSQI